MGINLAWLAIEGADRNELLARLGLEEAGDASNELTAKYACAESPAGWFILTTKDSDRAFEKALEVASSGRLAIAGQIVETVSASHARAVRDGVQLWSVLRDPDKDLDGLVIEGEPPRDLAEIRERLEKAQAADDHTEYMMEAPIELAERICGYRPASGRLDWSALRKTARAGREPKPKSLRAAIRSELVPLIQSLGWAWDEQEDMYVRVANGTRQLIWFNFLSGEKTAIQLEFAATTIGKPAKGLLQGRDLDRMDLLPFWKRLQARYLGPKSSPDFRVDQVIALAREDVMAIDAFLNTGERQSSIEVWGPAEDSWPAWSTPGDPPANRPAG